MKIMSVKNEFKCVVLEPAFPFSDILELFKARKVFYEDPDNFLADMDDRKLMLDVQRIEGPDLYSGDFFNPEGAEFILYKNNTQIVGSASLKITESLGEASFLSGYVQSSHRGKRLADLFYEARETYVREHSTCSLLSMWIDPENLSSRKAAERNGFKYARLNGMAKMVYEKTL